MNIDAIEAAIRSDNVHFPVTELIAIENTHNYCGGRVLPAGYMEVLYFKKTVYEVMTVVLLIEGFVLDGTQKRNTCSFRWSTDMECRHSTESTLVGFGSVGRFRISVLIERSRSTCRVPVDRTAIFDQKGQARQKGSWRGNETG